jgi:hypothetical protein
VPIIYHFSAESLGLFVAHEIFMKIETGMELGREKSIIDILTLRNELVSS